MKKRIAGVLLACVMALGMLPGALAAEPELRELWELEGSSSREESIEWNELSAENYDLLENMLHEQYLKNHKGAPDWTGDAYEEFRMYAAMYYGFYPEERADYSTKQMTDIEWMTAYQMTMDKFPWHNLSVGLPYTDGINVQVNGQGLTFPDARPEIRNDRTMVPFRVIAEALGMEVGYQNGEISAEKDGVRLSFRAGGTALTKTANGTAETIPMDAAPYIKGSRIYVPVRFFAEALGMQVEWSADYQAAVILDKDALISDIDRDFTLINKIFSQKLDLDPDKVTRTVLNLVMQLTMFDSLDGDMTYPVSLKIVSETLSETAHLTLKLDVKKTVDLLIEMLTSNPSFESSEENQLFIETIRKAMAKGDFEMILDADTEMLYCKSAMLAEFLKAYSPALVQSVDGSKIWFQIRLEGMKDSMEYPEMQEIEKLFQNDMTMGTLLYAFAERECLGEYVEFMKCLEDSKPDTLILFGDEAFTTSGSTHTIRFDYDTSTLDWSKVGHPTVEDALVTAGFHTLRGTLTITDGGAVTCDLTGRKSDYADVTAFTVNGSYRSSKLALNLDVHLRNTMKLAFRLDASVTQPNVTLPTAPPENELVLDLSSVLEDFNETPMVVIPEPAA